VSTRITPRAVRASTLLPGDIAPVPTLQASTRAGLLVEAWAVDHREDATDVLWLQLYDLANIADLDPEESMPMVAALPLRGDAAPGIAAYDFAAAPLAYASGLLLVVSSTPDAYTEITEGAPVAITARVCP
jgi:hypothetical protein